MKLSGGWIAAVVAALSLAAPATAAAQLRLPPILSPPSGGGPGATRPRQPALPPVVPGSSSTHFRLNPLRTGYSPDDSLIPPLRARWRRTFPGSVVAVLAAGNRLYVSADSSVYALERGSGKLQWHRRLGSAVHRIAYDNGRLFVAAGRVAALDGASGHILWNAGADTETNRESAPVATGGIVYVATNRGVLALDEKTGSLRWEAGSEPRGLAANGNLLIFNDSCRTLAVRRSDGTPVWSVGGGCSGEGPPIIDGNRVYQNDQDTSTSRALDIATGAPRPSLLSLDNPAYASGIEILRGPHNPNRIAAADTSSLRKRWGFAAPHTPTCVIGQLCSYAEPPIVVGKTVWSVGNGSLSAVELASGRRIFSAYQKGVETSDGWGSDAEPSASPGLMVVPAGRRVVAYSPLVSPRSRGISENVLHSDTISFGRATRLYGAVGHAFRVRGRSRVALLADRFRFGRFKRAARTTTRADGGFSFRVKPARNTRYRTKTGTARSRGGTIYVLPAVRARYARGRGRNVNRIRARVAVRGPRSVRLAGRRAYLYLVRVHRRRVTRLGGTGLGRAGRGRARGSIRFNALRHVGRRDYFFYCLPHLSRKGLGPHDYVDRHCGARRLRY